MTDKRAATSIVNYRLFQSGDEKAFCRLNETWISRYFALEEADRAMLGDPVRYILEPGGSIICATQQGEVIGCCALIADGPGIYEVAKMAVSETHQGQGVGKALLLSTIAQAQKLGARCLHLETNEKLKSAIHLYELVGFRHIPGGHQKPSVYTRADVAMELRLITGE